MTRPPQTLRKFCALTLPIQVKLDDTLCCFFSNPPLLHFRIHFQIFLLLLILILQLANVTVFKKGCTCFVNKVLSANTGYETGRLSFNNLKNQSISLVSESLMLPIHKIATRRMETRVLQLGKVNQNQVLELGVLTRQS